MICIVSCGIDLFMNIWRHGLEMIELMGHWWDHWTWLSMPKTVHCSDPLCWMLSADHHYIFSYPFSSCVGHSLCVCLVNGLPTLGLPNQCCAFSNHSPTIHSMLVLRSRITYLYNSWDKLMELCLCSIFAVKDPFQWRNLDTGVFGTIALVRSWWIYFGRILFHLPLEGFPGVLLVRLFCGVSDGSYDVVVGLPSLTRLAWTWGFFL